MTRKMTSLPGVTVFTVPDGNYDNNAVLPKNLIVIHTEDGFKAGTEARFTDPQSHVSAQYGVNQDGTYDEYVDEDQVAYHAGNYEINQRSIGIEHEDFGKPNDPRPDILYTASAKLVRDICLFWQIPIDRQHIVKHSEVSQLGTACPDSLDIDRIVREAQVNPDASVRQEADTNWNGWVALSTELGVTAEPDNKPDMQKKGVDAIKALKDKITVLNNQVGGLQSDNEKLTTNVKVITDRASALAGEIQATHQTDSTAIDLGIKAQTDLKNANLLIEGIATKLNSQDDQKSIFDAIDAKDNEIKLAQLDRDKAIEDCQKQANNTVLQAQKFIQLFINIFKRK